MYRKCIEKNYLELLKILNCVNVGIYITDGEGNTIFLNDESCKTGGLTREDVLGKNMKELVETGFVENSMALKVIESGKEESAIQNLGDGDKIYVTGTPLYSNNNISLVVCTERDITETINLKEILKEKEEMTEKYETELEYFRR